MCTKRTISGIGQPLRHTLAVTLTLVSLAVLSCLPTAPTATDVLSSTPTATAVPNEIPAKGGKGDSLGSVVGIVTDAETGKAVSNAQLKCLESGVAAISGQDGLFVLENLASGVYTLVTSNQGYMTDGRQVLVTGGEITPVAFRLWPLSAGVNIGREGGILTSHDMQASLFLPAGALKDKTTISITAFPPSSLNNYGDSKNMFFLGTDLRPDGLVFSQPVTMTLDLPFLLTAGTQLPLWLYDPESGSRPELIILTVGSDGHVATGTISHFTDAVLTIPLNGVAAISQNLGDYGWIQTSQGIWIPPWEVIGPIPGPAPVPGPVPAPLPKPVTVMPEEECPEGKVRFKVEFQRELKDREQETTSKNLCDGNCLIMTLTIEKFVIRTDYITEMCVKGKWLEVERQSQEHPGVDRTLNTERVTCTPDETCDTPTPTRTPTPTSTPTMTPSPSSTPTITPSPSSTLTPTSTPVLTPIPTGVPCDPGKTCVVPIAGTWLYTEDWVEIVCPDQEKHTIEHAHGPFNVQLSVENGGAAIRVSFIEIRLSRTEPGVYTGEDVEVFIPATGLEAVNRYELRVLSPDYIEGIDVVEPVGWCVLPLPFHMKLISTSQGNQGQDFLY